MRKISLPRRVPLVLAATLAGGLLAAAALPIAGAQATTTSSTTTTAPATAAASVSYGLSQSASKASAADSALSSMKSTLASYQQAYSDAKAAIPGLQKAQSDAVAAQAKAKAAYDNATNSNRTTLSKAWGNSIVARQGADKALSTGMNTMWSDSHRVDWAVGQVAADQAVADTADMMAADAKTIYVTTPSGKAHSASNPRSLQPNLSIGFSGSSVDSDWSVYNSTYNNNDPARTPSNVKVVGGVLQLTSSGASGAGLCLCGSAVEQAAPYGSYEVRAKVDANGDHGPAIMLWPNSENWPTDGEIDMAEFNSSRSQDLFTMHWGAQNTERHVWTNGDFTQWHTFRVDWTPDGVAFYIDNNLSATSTQAAAIPRNGMHLSIEIGPKDSTPSNTSSTLQVAWVKTYTFS